MSDHTEPKLHWTRTAGFMALFHAFLYSWSKDGVDVNVLYFDSFVVGCWMLGSNGRAALVDSIRHWKGGNNGTK